MKTLFASLTIAALVLSCAACASQQQKKNPSISTSSSAGQTDQPQTAKEEMQQFLQGSGVTELPADAKIPMQSSTKQSASSANASLSKAGRNRSIKTTPYDKPGFLVDEVDEVVWVRRPGQKMNDKHITLINAAPGGQSLKAVDRETAIEYLATKPGFIADYDEEGYLWVLKADQEKSDKHYTAVSQGPMRTSVKATDRDTAIEYLAAKPGYQTTLIDGYLWVLEPGDKPNDKHVTFVGLGPMGTSVKANDRDLLLAYYVAEPGFDTEIEEGRIWVLAPGETKSDKHVTLINKGPRNMTLKGVDRDTLNRYMAARHQ